MNKVFKWIFAIFVIASVFCGVGCKPEVEIKPTEKETGTIQGKAFYSNKNVDNHSGIQITLVSTDGLRSVAYCESRGIATNARSVSDIKTTSEDGSYSFENIPVGTYTIWASSRNSVEEAIETNVNVRANEVVTANDLNLVATGNIKGTITIDGKTDETLGLDVFIAGTSYVAKVGPTGNYEISKVPASKGYMLCVQKGEYTTIINEDLEVKAKETIEVGSKNLLSKDWAIENEVQTNPTFKWLGEFVTVPENPDLYDAYYNTTDGCSYIWNGSDWDLLAKAGEDGADGTISYPCIKDIIIPTAGEGFVGEIPVTIVGENLLGHVITCNDETFTDLTYLDDTVVTAKIKSDGLIGEKEVIVICGNSRVTGFVKVVATEKCFNVGDVLFTDGTRLKFENAKYGIPDAKRGDVFAVIGYAPYGGGTGVCVGLYKNNYVQWAPEGSFGHDNNFVGIQYNFETLYGDIDGSDNWDYICKIDPEGSKNAEVNYPAFHFANTYGSLFGLEGTNYENGWYIPSVYELYEIFKNKENVQQALKSAGGFSFVTAEGSDNMYISSSQSDYYSTNIYQVHFDFDAKYGRSKCSNDNVLVVQSVDCEEFMNYEITSIPKITSIEIPTVGEGYTGDVLVTISGENLAGHEIISDDVSFTNVNCINDKKTTVIIPCDGIVGERDITITIGGVSVTE